MKKNNVPAHLRTNIRYHVITETDPEFEVVAYNVIFQNQGTDRILIDGHFVLDPEETLEFNMLEGKLITHGFNIRMIKYTPPGSVADEPRRFNGHRLLTTVIEPETLM